LPERFGFSRRIGFVAAHRRAAEPEDAEAFAKHFGEERLPESRR
jgi:hypothetical protein